MNVSNADLIHISFALVLILIGAHAGGYLFQRFRLPQVIGEILGGFFLGKSCLKILAPGIFGYLFAENQATLTVLGSFYQFGLLLLMFCSGMEMRTKFQKKERRTAAFISSFGIIPPLAAAYFLFLTIDQTAIMGPLNDSFSLSLIFMTSMAVTSIPVISRILLDLGILNTSFSRIVLSSAVVEDIALYILISIALSHTGGTAADGFGLGHLLGISGNSPQGLAFHTATTIAFFGLSLLVGPSLFKRFYSFRFNLLKKRSPIGFSLIFMLLLTGIALFLDVAPMLGAFVAGFVAKSAIEDGATDRSRESLQEFSFAFFVPVYFAIVGLKLDVVHFFDFKFFLFFLVASCLIKIASIYGGARAAGEKHASALNFGMAMNARGGPGIVLASLAFDAKIINESFYVTLVLLAILTSLIAGAWLRRSLQAKELAASTSGFAAPGA